MTAARFGGRTRILRVPNSLRSLQLPAEVSAEIETPATSPGGCRQLYILCLYIMDFVTCFLVLI